jgi:hypothetical protein
MMKSLSLVLTMVVLLSSACADEFEKVGDRKLASLFGDDDRVESFEHPDGLWRDIAERSIVAIARPKSWSLCNPKDVVGTEPNAEEKYELCPDVRFAAQPTHSFCSGTLIGRDLVLTANHCVLTDEDCRDSRFIFGYRYESEGTLARVTRDDIYSCRRRIFKPDDMDVVVLQLDRPASSRYQPVALAESPPEIGDSLKIIGFPLGLPMKISENCQVKDIIRDQQIRDNCDTFPGNSGSGTFNVDGALVGVHTDGPGSLRPSPDGECNIYSRYTDEGKLPGIDSVPQLATEEGAWRVLAEFCDQAEWPAAFCDGESICGDGICSGAEGHETCATDCDPVGCGDGVCNLNEDLTDTEGFCSADCSQEDVAECPGDEPEEDDEEDEDVPEEKRWWGCGIGSSSKSAQLFWILLALAVGRRRKRTSRS